MMRAAKSSRAWIGALALVVAMAYSSDRAHVVHAVRFADKAKVFGLASGSGYLQGNGSGGVTESALVPGQLPGATGSATGTFVTTGVLSTQGTLGDSVAFGLGSSAEAGAGALGRLAKSRVAGTLRSTLPSIVARGGVGETESTTSASGVLGAFCAFASGQTVLASPSISIVASGGGSATIVLPAGARFINLLALAWVSELSSGTLDDGVGGSDSDYYVDIGTSSGGSEIARIFLATDGSPATEGCFVTAAPVTQVKSSSLTGTIYVTAAQGRFSTVDSARTASVRAALVGILVERETGDA